jgi:PD-(D/E)XK endonuclease
MTPAGYVRTTYGSHEVDAIAAYCRELERCYLIPIGEVAGMSTIRLRLDAALNNQAARIRWARDYELERSIRRHWPAALPSTA